jgi:hypothetical protein
LGEAGEIRDSFHLLPLGSHESLERVYVVGSIVCLKHVEIVPEISERVAKYIRFLHVGKAKDSLAVEPILYAKHLCFRTDIGHSRRLDDRGRGREKVAGRGGKSSENVESFRIGGVVLR